MINVIVKLKDKVPYSFDISGHAGHDAYGKDIVCAAASMIVINTMNAIKEFCTDENEIEMDDSKNEIHIYLKTIEAGNETKELNVLAKTLFLGLSSIREEYGEKHIRIKEVIECLK